mgnify:CR=1 FL=1
MELTDQQKIALQERRFKWLDITPEAFILQFKKELIIQEISDKFPEDTFVVTDPAPFYNRARGCIRILLCSSEYKALEEGMAPNEQVCPIITEYSEFFGKIKLPRYILDKIDFRGE